MTWWIITNDHHHGRYDSIVFQYSRTNIFPFFPISFYVYACLLLPAYFPKLFWRTSWRLIAPGETLKRNKEIEQIYFKNSASVMVLMSVRCEWNDSCTCRIRENSWNEETLPLADKALINSRLEAYCWSSTLNWPSFWLSEHMKKIVKYERSKKDEQKSRLI